MGEEKEAAWPERSEGLVRPVLCVSYVPQREAGFVSFHSLSVLGPSLTESHTLPFFQSQSSIHPFSMLWFGGFPEYLVGEKNKENIPSGFRI